MQDIKKIFDLVELKKLKNDAAINQKYELAAILRDHERFLESEKGLEFINNCKREIREKKLKRLF